MELALPETSAHARTCTTIDPKSVRRVKREVELLPPLEQKVIRWRYGLDGLHLTRRETAARLGISTRELRSLEHAGMAMLRLILLTEAH